MSRQDVSWCMTRGGGASSPAQLRLAMEGPLELLEARPVSSIGAACCMCLELQRRMMHCVLLKGDALAVHVAQGAAKACCPGRQN
jgi:hypothetical protein